MHLDHRFLAAAMACLVLATLIPGGGAVAQEAADTLFVEKDDEAPSNAELAVSLSAVTPFEEVPRVLLARDDDFADALASGVMQGNAPLLLVSPDGLQDLVATHIAELGPQEVVILGGDAAVPEPIADELRADGYAVSRRQGPSRFETATAIAAAEAPDATEAVLVRAFASAGADDPNPDATQAFADSLAAGGWSADTGFPVLLTQTEGLTPSTRDYLAGSAIRTVHIVGGTAAVSQAVADELTAMGITVDRIAGPSRADTALEIAKVRGADTAADVARVTLVDGESPDAWAGGFAAAAHSAMFNAPIVLGRDNGLPAVTAEFLAAGAPAQQGPAAFAGPPTDPQGIRLTCVIDPDICRTARDLLALPPLVEPPGVRVVEGDCATFASAQLTRQGQVLVVPVEPGCSPTLPADGPSLAFVDIASGESTVVPLPAEDFGSSHTLTTSRDGQVAAITIIDELAQAWIVRPDGTVTSVNEATGATQAGGTERSLTADGSAYHVFLQGPDSCIASCYHRYDVESGVAEPLEYCGGVQGITSCSSVVVSPGGGHLAFAGTGESVPWTAIRRDADAVQTVPLPEGSGDCIALDVSGSGLGLFSCDGRALLVDFAAATLRELPVTEPRVWTGDGSVVAALGELLRVEDDVVGAVGVAGARPFVSDVGTAVVTAPDGIYAFSTADVLDAPATG